MVLGPIGIQEEGKKYRKEREEKEERSRGKKGKHRKALLSETKADPPKM